MVVCLLVILCIFFHLPFLGFAANLPSQYISQYPNYPSLLKKIESKAEFKDPATCAMCHQDKFEDWQGSMHHQAFTDPIYRGELAKAHKEAPEGVTRQCEGCHSPAAFLNGEIKSASLKGLSTLAKSGVSCDVCHSVCGHTHWETPTHQPGNGSLVLSPGRDTERKAVLTKYGPLPVRDPEMANYHESIESPLHLTSELCAGCHQILHHEVHIPLESTYNEWKNGPYREKGIQCQDCHMVGTKEFQRSAEEFIRPSAKEYRHFFNGANFLLYSLKELEAKKAGNLNLAEKMKHKYDMAVSRLKLAAGLEVEPLMENGRCYEVKVTVKNLRAGHNLPTSLTTMRELWLELDIKDAQGTVLYSTGTVDGGGAVPQDARTFTSQGQDSNFIDAFDPWKITSFRRHNTIPPKGQKTVHYGMPAGLPEGDITVTVKLRYRQLSPEIAEKLLSLAPDFAIEATTGSGKIPELLIVDLAVESIHLN